MEPVIPTLSTAIILLLSVNCWYSYCEEFVRVLVLFFGYNSLSCLLQFDKHLAINNRANIIAFCMRFVCRRKVLDKQKSLA